MDDGAQLELSSSPTRLRVGGSYRYGAVLGNVLVLWCGAASLAAGAVVMAVFASRGKATSPLAAMGQLRLPGWLWNVYLPLLQPTVASAVAIAASSSATPLGAVCAAVGLAACVAPCAAAALLATRWFAATPQRSRESATEVSSFVALRLWRRLVREETAYADAVRGSEFVRRYGALFARYRGGRHWFVAVEAVHQVLLGVVRGTVGVAALGGSCAAPVGAAVAVAAAMLAAVALLRPYNTLLEACVGNAELALLLLGCVLILSVGGAATARFLEAEMCVGIVAELICSLRASAAGGGAAL